MFLFFRKQVGQLSNNASAGEYKLRREFLFIYCYIYLFIVIYIYSFIHSFIHSFIQSFIHSFIHSFGRIIVWTKLVSLPLPLSCSIVAFFPKFHFVSSFFFLFSPLYPSECTNRGLTGPLDMQGPRQVPFVSPWGSDTA